MSAARQSDCFKPNFFLWTVFGVWPRTKNNIYYKYFSFCYLFVTLIIYNILLTLNLLYTPRKIELLLREVVFYFTEIGVTSKVLMIILMRDKILGILDLLDCEPFKGDDDIGRNNVNKSLEKFKWFWKIYAVFSNCCFSSLVFLPLFIHVVFGLNFELPVCKYYFLTDDVRDKYFAYWYFYQSFGMYGHMVYNVSTDMFTCGLMFLAIIQFKLINYKMANLSMDSIEFNQNKSIMEKDLTRKFYENLKHYDIILKYCSEVQDIISFVMFVQFAMAAVIICIVVCAVVLSPWTTASGVFMLNYLFAMTFQIYLPGVLGSELSYQSQGLAFAAYNGDWIPRSEAFKRSLTVFVTRANVPIVLFGYKLFPLTLGTFASILKSAYSFYAVIRSVQDKTL